MVLLGTVAAFSLAVTGIVAAMEPAPVTRQAQVSKPAVMADQTTPVRVVGAPFVPNTNPRER